MVDLLEAFAEGGSEAPDALEPVRLNATPVLLMVFTCEADEARLHYVEDPTVRSYVPCGGKGCPLCYLGTDAQQIHLLPVLNVVHRAVEVLRVPTRRGPGSLATSLLPHLGEGAEDKLFLVSRNNFRHTVHVQALGEDADRCESVVSGFVEAKKRGLQLSSAFPFYSATDLAEVPSVRRALDAVGGWAAPSGTNAFPG